MFLKLLLRVPTHKDENRDYINLVCAFETDEQCYNMQEDNFSDIHDLLSSAIELHKGQGWKLYSFPTVIEFLYDDAIPDLSTLGYLRLS